MELSAAFRELTGLKRVMEFLARYALPVPLAMQLYRAYGAQALPRLKAVSYTHLDVYKRQTLTRRTSATSTTPSPACGLSGSDGCLCLLYTSRCG